MKTIARIQAYYLPQYHPIPENDEWWGKGFTEWTNVAKAKPLFKGHWQPHLPADLGFYDLRVPEVREAQAEMARNHGIEGFCYYHYWFGNGRQLLERPFNEVLSSGKPDFPFSLCWANGSWTGIWYGDTNKTLIEQTYPGKADYEAHFQYLLKAFTDERYITVDSKPMFQVHIPRLLPDLAEFTDTFRELAHKAGLPGIFLVAGYSYPNNWNPIENGFDAVVSSRFGTALVSAARLKSRIFGKIINNRFLSNASRLRKLFKSQVSQIEYSELIASMRILDEYSFDYFPCVIPNWDNTPRSGVRGNVVVNSTPELFKRHVQNAIENVQKYESDHRIIFVKSWNEWAEGNYLEPDNVFHDSYLKAIKSNVLGEI